jgi:dienelactone hydrolase
MIGLAFGLSALVMTSVALASSQGGLIDYDHQDTTLQGYLAVPENTPFPVPAVLIIHDWMGLGDHSRKVADRLAGMGYLAFAVDMYGKGVRPSNAKEAAELATKYKSDRKLMRDRFLAALEVLKKDKRVDQTRIAAIGYCFGGTVALESARSGAPLAGVVSFHGGLDTPTPQDARNINGRVLALHGADDPFVKPEEVAAFQQEMRNGKVDWQMVFYGNAVHAFTNPAAGMDNSKGAAYNGAADRRSWEAMNTFFGEIFQILP